MLNWLFGKSIESHLYATKRVRVQGLKFEIKKLNAVNYLNGTQTLKQTFDTYKSKPEQVAAIVSDKK